MLSRRQFLQSVAALGAASTFFWRGDVLYARAKETRVSAVVAAIEGGTLDPDSVPKFITPLLIPPVMPKAGTIKQKGKTVDYYEISMKQITQQILPAGLPATTVWGYGSVNGAGSENPLLLHNAPSLTIEAQTDTPVRVKWINDLKDANGNYLPHLLPVDPTLHWANPPGGTMGRDTRPTFTATPGAYTGPVPTVPHVHGAVGVGDESDGYAEAWYLPAAKNIPAGYATEGTWYNYFKGKAKSSYGAKWQPGSAEFQYPNSQRASTIWYHDHALGMTRLNVYAGPAGFFIIRGGKAGDKAALDLRTLQAAVLPGPAPKDGDGFPSKKVYYEIPIAIQDRSFNTNGSLFYPDSREFFDEITGSFIPETDIAPIWNPEFFGNMIMVNGNTWPFQTVEQRRYRFRFLNGCDSRFLILNFGNIPSVEVWMIGNEGGFLAAPVNITALGNQLLLGPAERADVIVDFTKVPLGSYVLGNVGPDEPFGGGEPDEDFDAADPDTTGQILQFRVVLPLAADPTTPPQFLALPALAPIPIPPTSPRRLALMEIMSEYFDDAPAEAVLGTVMGDPTAGNSADPSTWAMLMHNMWMDPVTENPAVGATEVWEFYNATADAHPMHIHDVVFQVVNRQVIFVDDMGHHVLIVPGSKPTLPEPWENGFKETVIAYPGQVTRVVATFPKAGQFVWHCHIVEHEDNEMMRPFAVGTPQSPTNAVWGAAEADGSTEHVFLPEVSNE
jgi:spore coat protein A, manganese oxidase